MRILFDADRASPDEPIECLTAVGRDRHERHFPYVLRNLRKRYDFADPNSEYEHLIVRAWFDGDVPSVRPSRYKGTLVLLEEERAVSVHMDAADDARGLGLPEAVLLLLRDRIPQTIYSSTNAQELRWINPEWRADGDKPWRRLAEMGQAVYDESIHRFRLLRP